MIGARVIKTCVAVTLSILTARLLKLDTPQFAGIIAVLGVQPSIYRTVRHGLQQTVSAVIGAAFGAVALYAVGNSFLVMGCVTLILMTLHVKMKWTNSLLVAVVISINTMGTKNLSFGESACNQIILVLIGIGVATLINMLHEPIHQERAELLVTRAEGMLRSLLHFMMLELEANRSISYPIMKEQIEQVRKYIEKGKEISNIISEDKTFRNLPCNNTMLIFQTYESMVERIRDMAKEMQKIDCYHREAAFTKRAIILVTQTEERLMQQKRIHPTLVEDALETRKKSMWNRGLLPDDFENMLAFYNLYGYLKEYMGGIDRLEQLNQHQPENKLSETGQVAENEVVLSY